VIGTTGRRTPLVTASVSVCAFLLCVVRVPWELHDVAWAEDANVFLRDALLNDPWSVLGYGYAGYLHLIPRLLAASIMSAVPIEGYAVAVFFVCAALTGLVCGAVFHLAGQIVPWLPARLTIAFLPVLLPLSAQEVLGNLANLHTLALWLALWIVFHRPASWPGAIGWAVVMFACVATEIQAIVLLLLAPFLVRRRDGMRLPVFAALALGGAWQVLVFASTPRMTGDYPLAPLSIPAGWLINTLMPMINADPGSAGIWLDATGLLVPALLVVPFLIAVIVALVCGSGPQRLLTMTLVLLSTGLYAASAWVNASWGLDYAAAGGLLSERFLHMRYGVSAGLLLAAVVPVAADAVRVRDRGARPGALRVLSASAVVGMVIVFAAAGTRSFPARSLVDGPWSAGAQQAEAICVSARGDQQVVLPVAPERVLLTDCAALRSYPQR
jgi:hypothetical protein